MKLSLISYAFKWKILHNQSKHSRTLINISVPQLSRTSPNLHLQFDNCNPHYMQHYNRPHLDVRSEDTVSFLEDTYIVPFKIHNTHNSIHNVPYKIHNQVQDL